MVEPNACVKMTGGVLDRLDASLLPLAALQDAPTGPDMLQLAEAVEQLLAFLDRAGMGNDPLVQAAQRRCATAVEVLRLAHSKVTEPPGFSGISGTCSIWT